MALPDVAHGEIEPLRVVQSVEIEVQIHIIFQVAHTLDLPQIAALESRIEKQRRVPHLVDYYRGALL